jgi:hypothetical protein
LPPMPSGHSGPARMPPGTRTSGCSSSRRKSRKPPTACPCPPPAHRMHPPTRRQRPRPGRIQNGAEKSLRDASADPSGKGGVAARMRMAAECALGKCVVREKMSYAAQASEALSAWRE